MTPYYSPRQFDIFIGIDTDKNHYSLTAKDQDMLSIAKSMTSDPENMYNYIRHRFPGQRVICAYEAGPTGFDLHDYLTERWLPCLVTSAVSIPKARNQKVKNNRIDSATIAHYLRSGEIKAVRVPQGPYRELRHLIRLREQYVADRKRAKQRIKGLLLYTALHRQLKEPAENWSNHYLMQLRKIDCSAAVRQRLDMLLMDLAYARKQTAQILKNLKTFIKEQPEIQQHLAYLESIPGIGFITAVTVLGNIGDPKDLKNVREIAGFVGLVPTEHSTGDTISRGSVSHFGDQVLRALLVEASWSAIKADAQLQQFYHRIRMKHHHRFGSQKAIVAVARKLTQMIYCVLKEQRMYVQH